MKNILKKGKEENAITFLHHNLSSISVFEHILLSNRIKHSKVSINVQVCINGIQTQHNLKNFSANFHSQLN